MKVRAMPTLRRERQELAVHREEGVDGDEVEYLIEDIKEKLLLLWRSDFLAMRWLVF